MLCQICKKNPAMIFMNKMEGGKISRLALCPVCALKQTDGLKQMFSQNGMNTEQLDSLKKQITDAMKGLDPSAFGAMNEFGELQEGMDPELSEALDNEEMTAGNEEDQSGDPPASGGENLGQLLGSFTGMIPEGLAKLFTNAAPQGSADSDVPAAPGESPAVPSSPNAAPNGKAGSGAGPRRRSNKDIPYLARFSTDLTEQARNGEIDNIVGRDAEIERIMQILNRRTKNNPVLLGEPGVGKTAIAEGLALRIARREVPVKLLNKEVRLLDLTGLVAGTQFRGQFEGRMKGIINEIIKQKNIILIIDEIHNIIGAGDAQNSMNAANILKPALAKGQIQIIGSTTLDEYRKYIEKDSALERRFQPVIVDEPSVADTIEILKGIRPHYEAYHNVSISDEVLRAAASLSSRYIHQRFLPDKAIDLLDEAAAKINLHNEKLVELDAMKTQLNRITEQKEKAAGSDNFEEAANLRTEELRLEKQIAETEVLCHHIPLTVEDIAGVVESWTKIPLHQLSTEETEKLLHLEDQLHKRIVGQDNAVEAVAKAIRRSRSGFRKETKPASFIFAGPTGVGKTELAKALAEEMFGSEDALIRIDMSEYMDKYTSSKLIGAPPGYVGYDDGGQLSEKVRRRPYSVVLMDEIEKAHPDIFNMLLQILDDGRLTDSQGRTVNFANTIVIMTTNAGSKVSTRSLGFMAQEQTSLSQNIQSALKDAFRPEFLNRVDDIITFDPLTKEELRQIVDLMLKDLYKAADQHKMTIHVSEALKDHLAEAGFDPLYGARPLRRQIQREVEDAIAEAFLRGTVTEGSAVLVDLDADQNVTVQKETL